MQLYVTTESGDKSAALATFTPSKPLLECQNSVGRDALLHNGQTTSLLDSLMIALTIYTGYEGMKSQGRGTGLPIGIATGNVMKESKPRPPA